VSELEVPEKSREPKLHVQTYIEYNYTWLWMVESGEVNEISTAILQIARFKTFSYLNIS